MLKQTAFFCCLLFGVCFNQLNAQNELLNKKLTLKVKKQTIPEILKLIEQKTNATINYNQRIIPTGAFSLNVKDEELGVVLVLLLQSHKLNFSLLYGNNIVITKAEENQRKHTISGFIYDEETGEKLINANVYNLFSLKGTATNQDGYYSLTMEEDSVKMVYSYIGYQSVSSTIWLGSNQIISVNLKSNLTFPTFTVSSKPDNNTLFKPDEFRMNAKTLKQFPCLFGETDVIKSLQLLPGVGAGTEGTVGLIVRGGSPDQNLILLDDVPVYNPSHIYGFFSIFNSDVVKDVTLIKGGISSRYGGRLSSVVDVRTIDGNNKKLNYQISIGILASKLTINGPISKNKKTTIVLSGRRSYMDILNAVIQRSTINNQFSPINSNYYFYDINGKINHRFNAKHQLSLSIYTGMDNSFIKNSFKTKDPQTVTKEKDRQALFWGNNIGSMRYNHVIRPKVFGWFLASYSRYNFGNESSYSYLQKNNNQDTENSYNYRFISAIRDMSINYNIEYKPLSWLNIKSGSGLVSHQFSRDISSSTTNLTNAIPSSKEVVNSFEFDLYTDVFFRLHRKVNLTTGLLYSQFNIQGVQYYQYQPRVNFNFKINKYLLFHAAYGNSFQFLHLLTNSTAGLPLDLWLPSTRRIKPESANIVSGGISYSKGNYLLNLEGFNKNMENLIEYKEQINYIGNDNNWEDKVTVGRGWAYGLETLLEKRNGKTTGWISYTYSWNFRQFNEINNGNPFPYKYDRRHNVAIVINHKFNEKIDATATWVYMTGANTTIPTQTYNANSALSPYNQVYIYGERNAYKLPDYHKMDMSVNFKKVHKKYTRIWSIGAYNIYNRMNAYYVTPAYNNNGERELRFVSLFPFLPNINYKISF